MYVHARAHAWTVSDSAIKPFLFARTGDEGRFRNRPRSPMVFCIYKVINPTASWRVVRVINILQLSAYYFATFVVPNRNDEEYTRGFVATDYIFVIVAISVPFELRLEKFKTNVLSPSVYVCIYSRTGGRDNYLTYTLAGILSYGYRAPAG